MMCRPDTDAATQARLPETASAPGKPGSSHVPTRFGLASSVRSTTSSRPRVCHMKTVSKREFYRTPALVRSLKAGQSVLVTDQGETSFLVVKPGRLPHKTTAELAAEAERLLPVSTGWPARLDSNPATCTEARPDDDMPTARMGGAALSVLEVCDPAIDTWESKAAMPTPRGWFTTSVVGRRMRTRRNR
jgi:antitoxin (DNA-binding transcriptional repressor) of toxin-antitoxin stability system